MGTLKNPKSQISLAHFQPRSLKLDHGRPVLFTSCAWAVALPFPHIGFLLDSCLEESSWVFGRDFTENSISLRRFHFIRLRTNNVAWLVRV